MSDDANDPRTFSLSEARSLLPKLRRVLARAIAERQTLVDMRPEIDLAREKAEYGGGSPFGAQYLSHLVAFSEAIQQIESLGVIVKDFQAGLVDFPHERDGRIIYLCWKLDEDEIGWWHEVESGFSGRQPLTEDFE